MSDASSPQHHDPSGQEPSEAEIRAYLDQLRNAGVDQVVAEVCTALINAAQVKLGRPDARLLLDVVGAVSEQVRGAVPDELTTQLDQALTQLRLAQVDAERQLGEAADQPDTPTGGDAETTSSGSNPASGAQPSDPAATPSGKRLWTPGG